MSIKATELLTIGKRYKEIDAEIKALEKEKERLKAIIVANVGRGNSRTVDNQLTFKVNPIEFKKFDDSAFKAADPETYEKFKTKVVAYDRISIKEVE